MLCFEAEQFELLQCANDPVRSSSRERSRSRDSDSDSQPATRSGLFERRTKHCESPDSGTAADERQQKALGTPNFCATPPCKVFSTRQPTVPATQQPPVPATKEPTVHATPPRTGIATEKVV